MVAKIMGEGSWRRAAITIDGKFEKHHDLIRKKTWKKHSMFFTICSDIL